MKRIIRIAVLVGVFGLILLALITSSIKEPNLGEAVWNNSMTLGDAETAVRHYVVYTDLMCPYCNYYGKTIAENDEEFKTYLSEHKILYEVRVTDMLYEGSGIEQSRPAAEAAYCASKENKFWDYYHLALESIFSDYYEKGFGYSKTAPKITDMTDDYWEKIGEKIGLGESFKQCFENHESVSEILENTYNASSSAVGLPYFVFGRYATGGFDNSWGWSEVKQMLNAGLK
ncbi:thioredoxin domain-containing protein [Candidatus Saccharibacteria bacterium]|nr:thioredoxin domain-containing protein [Candidatus Saccharibacteria bacterium]